MPLPNFLIIGAQKAGTSWLARMLEQHPEIYVYKDEIHFFDKSYNFPKGLEWYERHFEAGRGHRFIGEKTPDYLWANGEGAEDHMPDVHLNLHKHLPDAKLIAILRDPVTRAISAAQHVVRTGRVSPFISYDDLLVGKSRALVEGHGILEYGLYLEQIQAYLKLFKREQLLVLCYESDIVQEPKHALRKSCEFLGADSTFEFAELRRRFNAHKPSFPHLVVNYYAPALSRLNPSLDRFAPVQKRHPSAETVQKLSAFYREPNRQLEEFLGYQLPWRRD